MKHVHAELMAIYAQDALETCEPWNLWEYYSDYIKKWKPLPSNPIWDTDSKYRRKQKTIKIGNYDVPEPLSDLNGKDDVYTISIALFRVDVPLLSEQDIKVLPQNGIAYETKEDAEIAIKAIKSLFGE